MDVYCDNCGVKENDEFEISERCDRCKDFNMWKPNDVTISTGQMIDVLFNNPKSTARITTLISGHKPILEGEVAIVDGILTWTNNWHDNKPFTMLDKYKNVRWTIINPKQLKKMSFAEAYKYNMKNTSKITSLKTSKEYHIAINCTAEEIDDLWTVQGIYEEKS